MKKTLRRLQLDRETVRRLTPDALGAVAGGTGTTQQTESVVYSCDPSLHSRPRTACYGPTELPAVCA